MLALTAPGSASAAGAGGGNAGRRAGWRRQAAWVLLRQRADVNRPAPTGMTALHRAAQRRSRDGEPVARPARRSDAANRRGYALSLAVTNGSLAVTEAFAEGGSQSPAS
jgi:hypothetical protein